MKKRRISNILNLSADNSNMKSLCRICRNLSFVFLVLLLSSLVVQCAVIDKITGGTEVGSPSISTETEGTSAGANNESAEAQEATESFSTLALGTDGNLDVLSVDTHSAAEIIETDLLATKQFIESQDELQNFWDDLFPGKTAPNVDFTQFHVGYVVMGQQPTSGSAIEITGIELTDIDFNVLVTETFANALCTNTATPINPYHFVLIDKASANLRRHFVTKNVEQSCE